MPSFVAAMREGYARDTLRPETPDSIAEVAGDPAAFVASTDTLFLVADANASTNVAPLCAMLLQEVVDAAKAAAARLPGGRLDPPLDMAGMPAGDDPGPGEIGWYAPSSDLVLYYGDVGYWTGISRLGTFDTTAIDLLADGPDQVTVTLAPADS